MTAKLQNPLGEKTAYDQEYTSDLLFPIERSKNRESMNLSLSLPFHGEDLWTCYELSWLNGRGKPQVGIAYFRFPVTSPFMLESKSFKLYLNSLNHVNFENTQALQKLLVRDLSAVSGSLVSVNVLDVDDKRTFVSAESFVPFCLDDLGIGDFEYQPNPDLLSVDVGKDEINERFCSHLLRTNCPVTGQPDWGSLYIHYSGKKINRANLLRYIVSFRQCQDFHEHCVERIFIDLLERCQCDSLSVYARYTRRGGLDINPYRATLDLAASASLFRTSRQ